MGRNSGLAAIARSIDTPFLKAVSQVVLGGVIVLGVGILIGAS